LVVQEENPGFIFVPFIQKNDKAVWDYFPASASSKTALT
jgi:hypothetical protein